MNIPGLPLKIDMSFVTAVIVIVFGFAAALLSSAGQQGGPLAGSWWIGAVVGLITALAALLQKKT